MLAKYMITTVIVYAIICLHFYCNKYVICYKKLGTQAFKFTGITDTNQLGLI